MGGKDRRYIYHDGKERETDFLKVDGKAGREDCPRSPEPGPRGTLTKLSVHRSLTWMMYWAVGTTTWEDE